MKYKGYLLDLDGTIYLGNEAIPEAKGFVEGLKERGIPFLFVTNNTTKRPEVVQQRLANSFDIDVDVATIYTASLATIGFMNEQKRGNKVYVVGEAGLTELILAAGYVWEEINPDYVVVGLDSSVTYEKLAIATLAIQNGAMFIGTNPDQNIPTERGLLPGAGALISFLQTATRVEPIFIGKPEAIIMEKALKRIGLTKSEVIMVGDNYETDIKSGINNGIDTLLVLTGFTPKELVPELPEAPTFVVDTLAEWDFK